MLFLFTPCAIGRSAARPGMALIINPGKMLKVKMSIDLGCGNVRMTQQFLNRAQVATGFQHVTGKGMPEQVGVQTLVRAVQNTPARQATLDTAPAQAGAPLADKQCLLTLGDQCPPGRTTTVATPPRPYGRPAARAPCYLYRERGFLGPSDPEPTDRPRPAPPAEGGGIHQLEHGQITDFEGVFGGGIQ